MKLLKLAAVILALGLCEAAYSEDGSVTITAPAEGAKVALSAVKVVYDVAPGPKGDHVYVYVDGEQVAQLRQFKGSYTIDKLVAGKHTPCIRVFDKANTPVGLEKCVTFTAGDVPPMGY